VITSAPALKTRRELQSGQRRELQSADQRREHGVQPVETRDEAIALEPGHGAARIRFISIQEVGAVFGREIEREDSRVARTLLCAADACQKLGWCAFRKSGLCAAPRVAKPAAQIKGSSLRRLQTQ